MIDLHIHSNYSDGTFSIEEIIELAKKENLSQIAISDHNVLTGSIKAKEISPIDFVVACELSVDYLGKELHLLAYFPYESDYKNVEFIIKEAEANKAIALMQMVENLNEMGYIFEVGELKEFGKGTINRVQICNCLIKHGYINSVKEGFDKLIGDHCKAYVQRKVVKIEEAIEAIHLDNGLAVLAHPFEYKKYPDFNTQEMLNNLVEQLDGIECFHYSADEKEQNYLKDFATKHQKIITGGSDFHGENKKNVFLNMMKVENKYRIKKDDSL